MQNLNYVNWDTVLFKAVSRRMYSYSTDSALLGHVEADPEQYLSQMGCHIRFVNLTNIDI